MRQKWTVMIIMSQAADDFAKQIIIQLEANLSYHTNIETNLTHRM